MKCQRIPPLIKIPSNQFMQIGYGECVVGFGETASKIYQLLVCPFNLDGGSQFAARGEM